jgi:hypothetical protein
MLESELEVSHRVVAPSGGFRVHYAVMNQCTKVASPVRRIEDLYQLRIIHDCLCFCLGRWTFYMATKGSVVPALWLGLSAKIEDRFANCIHWGVLELNLSLPAGML